MATSKSVKRISSIRQTVIPVTQKTKFDALVGQLKRQFGRLGCPTCMSGINRIVITDPIARNIR
jgi:hypothetical protein